MSDSDQREPKRRLPK